MEQTRQGRQDLREKLRWVYLFAMGVLLLWYLFSLFTFRNKFATPLWIQILRCGTAILAVWLGRMWKEKGFWFLGAFFLLIFLRLLIPSPGKLAERPVQEMLFLALWLFTGCFGLARVAGREELKRLALLFVSVWTVAMVVHSGIGIDAAWTDQKIRTIGGTASWKINEYYRLDLVYSYNTAASLLCLSALMACGLMICVRKAWLKALIAAGVMAMLLAMSLTDSRTARIVFAFGFGAMICLLIVRLFQRKTGESGWKAWTAGALGMVLTVAVLVFVLGKVVGAFNQAKLSGGWMIPAARAEEIAEGGVQLAQRDMTNLSRRENIWSAEFQFFRDNPRYLLIGKSIVDPMTEINQILVDDPHPHCHNTLLQVLLVSGVPGLLLILGFLACVARGCVGLLGGEKTHPSWMSLIPAILLAFFAGEMVECFIVLQRYYTPMQAILFICMGIVCAYGEKKKRVPEGNSAAPAPAS